MLDIRGGRATAEYVPTVKTNVRPLSSLKQSFCMAGNGLTVDAQLRDKVDTTAKVTRRQGEQRKKILVCTTRISPPRKNCIAGFGTHAIPAAGRKWPANPSTPYAPLASLPVALPRFILPLRTHLHNRCAMCYDTTKQEYIGDLLATNSQSRHVGCRLFDSKIVGGGTPSFIPRQSDHFGVDPKM